jgi:hypothetical protein
MQKRTFYRSLLAISTIAMFWSAPALVLATELHPLVVTGIALDKVTTSAGLPWIRWLQNPAAAGYEYQVPHSACYAT